MTPTHHTTTPKTFFPRIRPTETVIACDGEPFELPAGTHVSIAKAHNGRLLALTESPRGWVWLDKQDLAAIAD